MYVVPGGVCGADGGIGGTSGSRASARCPRSPSPPGSDRGPPPVPRPEPAPRRRSWFRARRPAAAAVRRGRSRCGRGAPLAAGRAVATDPPPGPAAGPPAAPRSASVPSYASLPPSTTSTLSHNRSMSLISWVVRSRVMSPDSRSAIRNWRSRSLLIMSRPMVGSSSTSRRADESARRPPRPASAPPRRVGTMFSFRHHVHVVPEGEPGANAEVGWEQWWVGNSGGLGTVVGWEQWWGSEYEAGTVRRRLRVRRRRSPRSGRPGSPPGAAAVPASSSGSASAASRSARLTPSRSSAASRSSRSLSARPVSRISSATATACSLIASCAVSRPTPCRTAAISTLVVARNGR